MFWSKNLKYLRDKSGLSFRKLCKEIGIDSSTLRRLEMGVTSNPRLQTVLDLCEFFSVSIQDILYADIEKDK